MQAASERCTICDKPTSQQCTACKAAAYCSRPCQRKDSPMHKLICTSFRDLPERPLTQYLGHRRCVVFPTLADAPKFVWVMYFFKRSKDGIIEEDVPVLREEFLQGEPGTRKELPNYDALGQVLTDKTYANNIYRQRALGHTLIFTFRDGFKFDGSSSNKSIVAATQGSSVYDWHGPVLVMRQRRTPRDAHVLEDMTPADVRSAAEFFVSFKNPDARAI